jgi:G3E family GTPase
VARGKGVLWLRERPERRTIFQLVGRRWELAAGDPWGDTIPGSRLVLIGTPGSIAPERLDAALAGPRGRLATMEDAG